MFVLANLCIFVYFLLCIQTFFIEYHIFVYILLFITPIFIITRFSLVIYPLIFINFFWSFSYQLSNLIIVDIIIKLIYILSLSFFNYHLFSIFWEI